jgi:hypothetical protein
LIVRPEPTGVKNLSGASLNGRFLSLPINIGLKCQSETNILDYNKHIKITALKSLITLVPDVGY